MSMEQPTFNPHDEKFKKVADLPEEEQKNFKDVESGGFIRQEAAENTKRHEEMREDKKNGLSFTDKIMGLGFGIESVESRVQTEAIDMNYRERSLKRKEEDRAAEERHEEFVALKWAEFEKVQEVNIKNSFSMGNFFDRIISFESQEGKFKIDFSELIKKGIITSQDLVGIFQSELKWDSIKLKNEFLPGAEEKLGKILGKKVVMESK